MAMQHVDSDCQHSVHCAETSNVFFINLLSSINKIITVIVIKIDIIICITNLKLLAPATAVIINLFSLNLCEYSSPNFLNTLWFYHVHIECFY